jgi:L-iditol 2-dehydrogenase
MSKEISAQEACFLEPVASVLSGIKKLRLCAGENLVIIGAGTTGLLCAQVARAFGARVILSDLYQKKIERAQAMGNFEVIDGKSGDPVALIRDMTNGLGADAIIPSVGVTTVYRQALEMLKHFDGRMLLYAAGYPKPSLPIDPNDLHYHRREIIGTAQADREDYFDAAFMISNGIIDCKPCLEGITFPLRDIQKALWALNKPSMYRISLDCQGI